MQIVETVSTRGTCDRGYTASVIVKDRRIIGTGYVGSPYGLPHCDDAGHQLKTVTHEDGKQSTHCVRTIHSELNAICQAARFGTPLEGATMYMKMTPCYTCGKALINAGIKRVVCKKDYHDSEDTKKAFKEAGIELVILTTETMQYDKQK